MRPFTAAPSVPDRCAPGAEVEPEITFLKAVGNADARAIAALTLGRRLDLTTLGQFLVHERMGVYVHARLKELGLGALVPRQVAEPIRWQHGEQQQRNTRLLALLGEVQEGLTAMGTEVMVIKGLPMSQRFWGGIDRRFSFDLDLLVPRDQFQTAAARVIRLGFSTPRRVRQSDWLALHLSHALELARGGLCLDLHWTLRNRPGLRFDLAATWASATQYRLGGTDCRVPSDEDQLVILLTGLANDLERGHHRLRSLWDIYLMLKALPETDWRAFWESRADQGLTALLVNLLALVLWRLDCADEFPDLAAALANDPDRLITLDPEAAHKLLTRAPQSPANRQWFASLLPVPAWRYWAWWVGTLPLRSLIGRHI